MDEHEREARVAAAEVALTSLTTIVTNWSLLGETALASQALAVADELAAELRNLQDGAG